MNNGQEQPNGAWGVILILASLYSWAVMLDDPERRGWGILILVITLFSWRAIFQGVGGLIKAGTFFSVFTVGYWFMNDMGDKFTEHWMIVIVCPALLFLRAHALKAGYAVNPIRRLLRRLLA